MILGNPEGWTERFRSIDQRLLSCINRVWPSCVAKFNEQPEEDQITINLVNCLMLDQESRRMAYIEYQYEPFADDGINPAYSLGKIDMAVILDANRDCYVAYECKRLNVMYSGRKKSLATEYVQEGLKRFVIEQYSRSLSLGCMLGYVLDNDVQSAYDKTTTAIMKKSDELQLVGEIHDLEVIGATKRYMTIHQRRNDNTNIEIRHTLLGFKIN